MRSTSTEVRPQLMPVRGESSDRTESLDLARGGKISLPPPEQIESSPLEVDLPLEVDADQQQTHSRLDVFSGRWTLFASHRIARPNEYVVSASPNPSGDGCPFCEGNEHATPDPILVVGTDESAAAGKSPGRSSPGWGIRVVPNKFPAVDPLPPGCGRADDDEPHWDVLERHRSDGFAANGSAGAGHSPGVSHAATRRPRRASDHHESSLFTSRRTFGGHEVFIESPEHCTSLADLDLAHVATLLGVYQSRLRHWRSTAAIQYVSLFKNVGPAAGASLHHPHSQLIALTELPRAAKRLADRMQVHHAHTGCCLQCDMLRAEMKAKQRVVAVTDSLIAYCPFASHLPMLLRVTTRRHVDQFELLNEQEIDEMARLIRRSIGWLRALYPDAAYNFLIHTRPPGVPDTNSYHWSFELFPRLTQTAGFEWSCDCTINPTLPEDAAEQLHNIAVQENPLRP